MTIGQKIKNLREAVRWTQQDLANEASVTRVSIGNYERGDRNPKTEVAERIASALGVRINRLTDNELGEYLDKLMQENDISSEDLYLKTNIPSNEIENIKDGEIPDKDVLILLASALANEQQEVGTIRNHLLARSGYVFYLDETTFFDSMTPEETKKNEEDNLKWQIKNWNIKQYQEKTHVRLEDFLNDTSRKFYIDDHKLTNEEIGMLITLYGGKEKDYPSDEQIEKEYEEIKKINEENKKRISDGEIILAMNSRYDINTNEDI